MVFKKKKIKCISSCMHYFLNIYIYIYIYILILCFPWQNINQQIKNNYNLAAKVAKYSSKLELLMTHFKWLFIFTCNLSNLIHKFCNGCRVHSQSLAIHAHTNKTYSNNRALKLIQTIDVMLNSFNTIASNHTLQILRPSSHVEIDPRCNDSNL